MKHLNIPRPRKVRSFDEKFSRDAQPFGNGKAAEPVRFGHIPLILLGALGAAVLTLILLLLSRLWEVSEVTAEDGQLYSAALLVEKAGVVAGDEYWGFDTWDVGKQLKKELPLIEKAKVRRHLDGSISISVTEVTNLYYTCHNVNYYIISAEDREVLSVDATPHEARRVGAIYLGLPSSTRVRVGDKLSFVNLPYAPETEGYEYTTYEVETDEPAVEYAYVFDFVKTVMDTPLAPRITGMELGDRYNIYFILDNRIKIRIGDMSELDRKLDLGARTLADQEAKGNVTTGMPTLIDVSDPAVSSSQTSPDIELPAWAKGAMPTP